jgi:hypothetical protein
MMENPQIRSAAAPAGLSKPAVVATVAAVEIASTFRTSNDVIEPRKMLRTLFDELRRR